MNSLNSVDVTEINHKYAYYKMILMFACYYKINLILTLVTDEQFNRCCQRDI